MIMDVDPENSLKFAVESVTIKEKFSINWRVDGISSLEVPGSKYINSCYIPSKVNEDCKYFMRIYPVERRKGERTLTLCIFARGYDEFEVDVTANVKLTNEIDDSFCEMIISGIATGYNGPHGYISWKDFHFDNETSRLTNDALILRVLLTAVWKDYHPRNKPENFGNDLCKLRLDDTWADVEIIASGITFKAHKSILSARSPVFAAMFSRNNYTESQIGRVEIDDITPETVNRMLDYVYTGTFDHFNLDELLVAADKYCLQGLKEECCAALWCNLTDENGLRLLAISEKYGCDKLEKMLWRFVSSHPRERIQQSADLSEMTREQLYKLIKSMKFKPS